MIDNWARPAAVQEAEVKAVLVAWVEPRLPCLTVSRSPPASFLASRQLRESITARIRLQAEAGRERKPRLLLLLLRPEENSEGSSSDFPHLVEVCFFRWVRKGRKWAVVKVRSSLKDNIGRCWGGARCAGGI